LRFGFANRPLEVLVLHNNTLGLHKTPSEELEVCNVAPAMVGGAGGQNPAAPVAGSAGESEEEG
jgi:hypothetical protein